MGLLDFIRLMRKHLILLVLLPLLMAGLVILATRHPKFMYTSQTILYTGLATGSSIEMDKTYNYFATNTAFDNLINIINSRETQQEIAIRLLSQHLLLGGPNPKYIARRSFEELEAITPSYIYPLVVRHHEPAPLADTTENRQASSGPVELFPSSIHMDDYELTVRNLTLLMKSSDTNFVYKLLNYEHPHYSIKAISTVKAARIGTSDLIKLSFESDDPGICQQTLALFNEVCIKNYKNIRENRSDDVVKYFEEQLGLASQQLRLAEDKLLAFNKSNNIINYYEQSKAVAVVKEDMEVDYNNKKAQLAGHEAAIKRLEEKLDIQQLVQLKSNRILDKRNQLGDINYAIANAEADAGSSQAELSVLKGQATSLQDEIRKSVDELYTYQNTIDGLPVSKVLSEWINNVVEAENIRAKLLVMDQRNREFQQQYSIYAPAGALIKRIEREISVSEQGYLEILHGLNLAKLKLQDSELASNLKVLDSPYYPITPVPTKRKILVAGTFFLGLMIVLGAILSMEYFDDTLKNLRRSSRHLGIPAAGMLPKIYRRPGIENFAAIQQRLVEIISQNIAQALEGRGDDRPRVILVLSTLGKEGKSILAGNLARHFLQDGKECLYINTSGSTRPLEAKKHFSFLTKLLGYNDPTIDGQSPFLQDPVQYLPAGVLSDRTLEDIRPGSPEDTVLPAAGQQDGPSRPEYIFIELPALLDQNYPAGLVRAADLSLVVCRSNRVWTDADRNALDNYRKQASHETMFVLNGVEVQELESLVGELPKKRSSVRKMVKNAFRLQFFAQSQF